MKKQAYVTTQSVIAIEAGNICNIKTAFYAGSYFLRVRTIRKQAKEN